MMRALRYIPVLLFAAFMSTSTFANTIIQARIYKLQLKSSDNNKINNDIFQTGSALARFNILSSSAIVPDDHKIGFYGYNVDIRKNAILDDVSMLRRRTARVGFAQDGLVFCTTNSFKAGPFMSDNLESFNAILCLIDENQDGYFEAASLIGDSSLVQQLIGLSSFREVGPVKIEPISYRQVTGEYNSGSYVDLVIKNVKKDSVFIKPVLFIDGKQYKSYRLRTLNINGPPTDFEYGCVLNVSSPTSGTSVIANTQISVRQIDENLKTIKVEIGNPQEPVRVFIEPDAAAYGLIPSKMDRCGDKQSRW